MLQWIDGQPASALSLADRGLAYGDGLFETIAVRQGRAALLPRHLQRLREGIGRLALPVDWPQLVGEIEAFIRQLDQGVAKLLLTRGDGLRGYPMPAGPARRILLGGPLPAYPAAHAAAGVRVFACQLRLAEQPRLAGLKHLNRLEQVLARSEWQSPEFAEGLLQDTAGRVVEGVFSNLFIIKAGQLHTPQLTRCGVAGVMRAELLELAQALGLRPQVRDIELSELLAADEWLLCNSLYGIWPVREYAGRQWPHGPWTQRLQAALAARMNDR